MEIINIDDDDDDEISVTYETTPFSSVKKGATKFDAISVEDYHPRELKWRRLDDGDDDDVKFLHSLPKTRKRIFKGECSNSKTENDTKMKTAPLTFLCEICSDEKPKDEIFGILVCRHSYCSKCMEKYVASRLQDNVIAIGCLVSGCKGFLEPQHSISILPKQVFDRWGDALCEAMILDTEKFYCPFKDCSALLVDDKNGKNEVIGESECPDCNYCNIFVSDILGDEDVICYLILYLLNSITKYKFISGKLIALNCTQVNVYSAIFPIIL
ncbi:hypothetical protein PHJA_001679200 [Phtheirospermum japonicum]|uniref:RING-type domain-containing protein n=1 Tax=Phtheirospermum japonicum TaxID=374723 RepID=A0A830C7T3_9LAMI|nr:hypothetical protein PHJA_001679200 [Phtheirospermum japonicum]